MKILLVDDEEAILEVFKQALSQDPSFTVFTALTGNQGLELTKKEHPDVIFLDQVLPDMNGNDVLQQLKSDPETKNIPIAILSNFNQDTLVENAMKMGASDYILKYQIAPRDLLEKAKNLLKENNVMPPSEQTVAAVAPVASLDPAPIPAPQPGATPSSSSTPAQHPISDGPTSQVSNTTKPATVQEPPLPPDMPSQPPAIQPAPSAPIANQIVEEKTVN